ncbi:MAG: hypothetical protein EZS28_026150, partial [Streblomastix strix]
VRLEEKEQEKEREDELKRMRDEVELKEELQMRKKLGAQSGTSLNDGTDGELINDKNQDKNISFKVSDSNDQLKKLFTYAELHAQKHACSEQLDARIERLANLYQSIPLLIQYTVFKILTINQMIKDAMFILIFIFYVIYQYRFTDAHTNIVISGIYQSLLMIMKFVSG